MKRASLLIMILLGALFSLKGFAAVPVDRPLYVYYDGPPYSYVYSIDLSSSSVVPLPKTMTGGPFSQLMLPGGADRDLIYSGTGFNNQILYVVSSKSQTVEKSFDMGTAPEAMQRKGICWAYHGDRVYFFGSKKKSSTIFIYDGRENQMSMVTLAYRIIDAATDLKGNLFIATSTRKLQRFDMNSMSLTREIALDREPVGVFRLGGQIVLLDQKGLKQGRWTRFDSDLLKQGQEEFGLLSSLTWHAQHQLLFIRQQPYSPTYRSQATLIVMDPEGERCHKVPQVLYQGDHFDRLKYPFLYVWGMKQISEIDLRTGDTKTVTNLEGDLSNCEFFPDDGGGSGIFFISQMLATYDGLIVDFNLNASLRVPVGRALAVYLPRQRNVAVYRSSSGQLQLLTFPNGDIVNSFDVGKGWRSVFSARDERSVILEGAQGWHIFDTVSQETKAVLPPPDVQNWNYLFQDAGYIDESDNSSVVVLRQDGVHVLRLPDWNLNFSVLHNWDIKRIQYMSGLRLITVKSTSL